LEDPQPFTLPGQVAGKRYLLGRVWSASSGYHDVALAMLHEMGNNMASARATQLLEHFPTAKNIIMVGIAGGVPSPQQPSNHVRLGDIVVSDKNGVIQYDNIKKTPRKITQRHPPRPPSAYLIEAVQHLKSDELTGTYPWRPTIDRITQGNPTWARPLAESDILHDSTNQAVVIAHPADPTRAEGYPRVFHGPIAASNTLLKDPQTRDRLRDQFGIKAIEMEGSGIADATWTQTSGYLVIRGICDYCDKYKNDDWHNYAALVAAAYMIALLRSMPISESGSDPC
jgi:nucleoside phosphorylase